MEMILFSLMWVGQSCFVIEADGKAIVMDPVPPKLGYSLPAVEADIVTISHNHFDHTYMEMVKGWPKVLRGLTEDGSDWHTIDYEKDDIRIQAFQTYHDADKGAERGKNAMFLIEINDVRILHTGDLGHMLDDAMIEKIGRVDVLLICVGGFYTIDAKQARSLVEKIGPRVVVPMHYKTDPEGELPIASNDEFLKGWKNVRKLKDRTYPFTQSLSAFPEGETTILVLTPKKAATDTEPVPGK
ncbi:MAG: MBL fold metallo-hydrolase [Candidatus Sumerlaeia bacterium]